MSTLSSSVIICTRNRMDELGPLFDSLLLQTYQPNELIVIDSSDKPLIENPFFLTLWKKNTPKGCKLVYKHTVPGLTYQRNRGISSASGDIIYFFDDDVVLEKNYLQEMQDVFEHNPQYGGGMGSITNTPAKQNDIFRLLRIFFLLQRDYASGQFTLSGMPTHAYGCAQFKMVEVLGGCCMAYRATVFKNHRFDELLRGYAYMEDCDISRRISYEWPLFFNPKAQLQHNPSPLNRDSVAANRAMYIKNYRYLFFKNIYPRNRLKIFAYWLSIFGLLCEAVITRNKYYLKGYYHGLTSKSS